MGGRLVDGPARLGNGEVQQGSSSDPMHSFGFIVRRAQTGFGMQPAVSTPDDSKQHTPKHNGVPVLRRSERICHVRLLKFSLSHFAA